MTRISRRTRPRVRSVDFSRLWWLLRMEAAFQVVQGASACHHATVQRGAFELVSLKWWANYRRCARTLLRK